VSAWMEREIVVQGEGEARCLPDRAVIEVIVDAESPSHDGAYQEAATSAKQVDDVIESRRGALERVTTAALVVHPTTRWKKGEVSRTGWRAARSSRLEVTGLDQIGELIAELAAAGAAVNGPRWEVDAANPVHRETRRAAAQDARHRAEDYAAALGLELGDVAWISEPGIRRSPRQDHSVRAFAAMASSDAAGGDVLDVTPEELTIGATVEVGFSLAGGSASTPA
jgi:uncharacterized protein